jgi:hypothetical protein
LSLTELVEKSVSTPEEEQKRQNSLRHLIDSFIATARPIAERLILESFLPAQKRTYASVQIGGRAGGVKYVVNNIFFKFARDSYGYYVRLLCCLCMIGGSDAFS